ncbi:hypothetical protein JXA47_01215, partial [Candidatus Sumerlaeota bacterium]|nr:hypothetical protein [Candidatus Sumerlaeota bacterium]
TVQGIANRRGPHVVVESPRSERSGEVLGTWHWLETFHAGGEWLEDRGFRAFSDVAELLPPRVAVGLPEMLNRISVRGLVVFDPDVPASSNVAVSLAAREGLAVTGPDGLMWVQQRCGKIPIVHDLRGRFRGKGDAHRWLIENLLRGRSDLRLMSYVMDAWRRDAGGSEDGMDVEGMDMVIASGGVAFDLSPWRDEVPVDDPGQTPGQDAKLWDDLFAAAAEARGGEAPLEITGFPFWRHKYSNFGSAGGSRRPVEAEWQAVWRLSPHGTFLNPLIAPNMSFHRYAPLPNNLRQPDPGPPPPLENKTYVCLHLGDFDGGYGVYRRLPRLWEDPRRGELPLGWGINPNMARCYPDIIGHVYATRTPNDHFVADASGAGYVNPNRVRAGLEFGLWRRFSTHWYRRLDYTLSPMVLDQNPPTPAVLDAMSDFSHGGAAFLIENRQGKEVPRVEPKLWAGMPITRLEDLSYAESDVELVDWILRYAEGDPTDGPAFHIFRFEWRAPSVIFDTFREVQRRAGSREWVALHPRQWFRLLKRWLSAS